MIQYVDRVKNPVAFSFVRSELDPVVQDSYGTYDGSRFESLVVCVVLFMKCSFRIGTTRPTYRTQN